jgi:hypothetical protein
MIYWLIFLGIIIININIKNNGLVFLRTGFYSFIISSVLSLLEMFNLAEFAFRICLILLLSGIIFSAKSYLAERES